MSELNDDMWEQIELNNYGAGWLDAEAAIRKEAGKWQT